MDGHWDTYCVGEHNLNYTIINKGFQQRSTALIEIMTFFEILNRFIHPWRSQFNGTPSICVI